jgi:hypothetical protein
MMPILSFGMFELARDLELRTGSSGNLEASTLVMRTDTDFRSGRPQWKRAATNRGTASELHFTAIISFFRRRR